MPGTGRTTGRITPTRNAHLALCCALLLAGLGASTHDVWPTALACGLFAALLVCWVGCRVAPVPSVRAGFAGVLTVGEPATSVVGLTNPGTSWTRPAIIVHRLCKPLVEPVRCHVEPLPPGNRVAAPQIRIPTQRGLLTHSHVDLECPGPFGLFVRRHHLIHRQEILVLPENVRPLPLPALAGGATGARSPSPDDELRGVREWRAGDSPRHVHWRSTARTGALTVVERGEPKGGSLLIVVGGTWGDPEYEGSLATATATGCAALGRGSWVALFVKTDASKPAAFVELDERTARDVVGRLDSAFLPDDRDLSRLATKVRPGTGVLLACDGPARTDERWLTLLDTAVLAAGGTFVGRAPS